MSKWPMILLAVLPLCGNAAASWAPQVGYRIGKLDVIRVEVGGDESLSRELSVSENGTINYSVLGELRVEGLTVSEVAELIRSRLVQQQVLTQATVSVSVKDFRSQYVTVLGEVLRTGRYYLRGPERLVDVIAEAGGLSPNAGDITLTRQTPKGFEEIVVRSADLLRDSTALEHGDVIYAKTKPVSQVFVSGEVTSVKPLVYFEGMTLSQAILSAGGLTRFGAKTKITIKRTIDGKERLIRANLADIEKGRSKDIPVLPNDLIVVGRRIF